MKIKLCRICGSKPVSKNDKFFDDFVVYCPKCGRFNRFTCSNQSLKPAVELWNNMQDSKIV